MWRLIGISPEGFYKDEVNVIINHLESGFDCFHIRKPFLNIEKTREYLESFPLKYRERLSLHDHHSLSLELGIGGIHINARNSHIKEEYKEKRLSVSCHSLKEVEDKKEDFDYLFLSPIYNSISKAGYKQGFSKEELIDSGLIDKKLIALGGIREENFQELKEIGFGGAALLGSIWEDIEYKDNNNG